MIIAKVEALIEPCAWDNKIDELRIRLTDKYGEPPLSVVRVLNPGDFKSRFDLIWEDLGHVIREYIKRHDAKSVPSTSAENKTGKRRRSTV